MQKLAKTYQDAKKITLIQDNVNTHNPSSVSSHMAAPEAFALAQRFELHYTPKKARWLTMAEIEFSALATQCLDHRIDHIGKLALEVKAWTKKRNRRKVKIHWQFTKDQAREKFNRHYQDLCQ